jgi:hypothetical protein
MKQALWALLALALAGCHGEKSVDFPVSSPPGDSRGAHRNFAQSETSMVRVDQTADRPEGEPAARYVLGYNDDTSAVTDAGCFDFIQPQPSLDGLAVSNDFGDNWVRHDQLPVTTSLKQQNVRARHGDPWLASWSSKDPAIPGIVLYVSVAQSNLAHLGSPFALLLTRSRDNGKTFEDSFVLVPPLPAQSQVPDGPKIAITGDGTSALVVWKEAGKAGVPYRIVWNLDGNLTSSQTALLDPVAIADPPDPSCRFSDVAVHPHVVAGRSTYYVGALITYSCTVGGSRQRLEVYRNPAVGIALGFPWERILSVAPPPSAPSASFGLLNTQIANPAPPQFGNSVDRGSILPALAVGQAADGEFLVAADLQVQNGTLPDELQREKVILFRLPKADTCDARHHKADLDSCGTQVAGREIDQIAQANGMKTVGNRAGIWESKPVLFTGKVPDGTVDPRVGVMWYSQPYKGRGSVTDEMRARTIVEAAVSKDAGVTFQGPFNLSAATSGDGSLLDDSNIGSYFHPCQILCSRYYGEYLSGVFVFADPGPTAILGAWGDSREGCTSQTSTTKHQHVWAGAVRAF